MVSSPTLPSLTSHLAVISIDDDEVEFVGTAPPSNIVTSRGMDPAIEKLLAPFENVPRTKLILNFTYAYDRGRDGEQSHPFRVRVAIGIDELRFLRPDVWWSGDFLTQVLSLWQYRLLEWHPSMRHQVHICNTYALPSMDGPLDDAVRMTTSLRHCRVWGRGDTLQSALPRLLSAPFIVVPLHLANRTHWGVAIVINVWSLVEKGPSRALILVFDSLPAPRDQGLYSMREDHWIACNILRRWLLHAVRLLNGQDRGEADIRVERVPFTALQPNGADCGLYVWHHVDAFFKATTRVVGHFDGIELWGSEMRRIWGQPDALDCRWRIANLVIGESAARDSRVIYDL